MNRLLLVALLSSTATASALAQERQLYRLTDIARPYKGHLLGPESGATPTENFETCEGTKLKVTEDEIEMEPGTCRDSGNPGSLSNLALALALARGEISKIPVYNLSQDEVAHIETIIPSYKNDQYYIVKSIYDNSSYILPKNSLEIYNSGDRIQAISPTDNLNIFKFDLSNGNGVERYIAENSIKDEIPAYLKNELLPYIQ